MTDKEPKVQVVPLLDDIAADAIAASEAELREQLLDAGVDPDTEIQKFRQIGEQAAAQLRAQRIEALPDEVPEDPIEVRALLNRLLAMPNAPSEGFTLAYRDNNGTTDNDTRVLTQHLLELLKKQNGS